MAKPTDIELTDSLKKIHTNIIIMQLASTLQLDPKYITTKKDKESNDIILDFNNGIKFNIPEKEFFNNQQSVSKKVAAYTKSYKQEETKLQQLSTELVNDAVIDITKADQNINNNIRLEGQDGVTKVKNSSNISAESKITIRTKAVNQKITASDKVTEAKLTASKVTKAPAAVDVQENKNLSQGQTATFTKGLVGQPQNIIYNESLQAQQATTTSSGAIGERATVLNQSTQGKTATISKTAEFEPSKAGFSVGQQSQQGTRSFTTQPNQNPNINLTNNESKVDTGNQNRNINNNTPNSNTVSNTASATNNAGTKSSATGVGSTDSTTSKSYNNIVNQHLSTSWLTSAARAKDVAEVTSMYNDLTTAQDRGSPRYLALQREYASRHANGLAQDAAALKVMTALYDTHHMNIERDGKNSRTDSIKDRTADGKVTATITYDANGMLRDLPKPNGNAAIKLKAIDARGNIVNDGNGLETHIIYGNDGTVNEIYHPTPIYGSNGKYIEPSQLANISASEVSQAFGSGKIYHVNSKGARFEIPLSAAHIKDLYAEHDQSRSIAKEASVSIESRNNDLQFNINGRTPIIVNHNKDGQQNVQTNLSTLPPVSTTSKRKHNATGGSS